MKNISKKIITLILALVMTLGCIPSFVSIANEDDILIENIEFVGEGIFGDSQTPDYTYIPNNLAGYTISGNASDDWYIADDYNDKASSLSKGTTYYKKITLTANSGYKFEGWSVNTITCSGTDDYRVKFVDNKIEISIEKIADGRTIAFKYTEPTNEVELFDMINLTNLTSKRDKFIAKTSNRYGFESGYFNTGSLTTCKFAATNDLHDGGYHILFSIIEFSNEAERNSLEKIDLNGHDLTTVKIENPTEENITNHLKNYRYGWWVVSDNSTLHEPDNDKFHVVIADKYNFTKTINVTADIQKGKKVSEVLSSLNATISHDTPLNIDTKKIIEITSDGTINLTEDIELEQGKNYRLYIFSDSYPYAQSYSNIIVNGKTLSNLFYPDSNHIEIAYDFNFNTTSSKKYKAIDENNTCLKITGTGKKNSTRTIYPLEDKDVLDVKVVDKNDKEIEVTKNDNDTYSFKQPASNVYVNVYYKETIIKLFIGSNEAYINNKLYQLDAIPEVINNRTMFPIRFIFETLGAEVIWNRENPNEVIINKDDKEINLTLSSDIAYINNEEYKLETAPYVKNNRTYLPVRFITEALGCEVIWDKENPNKIIIKK